MPSYKWKENIGPEPKVSADVFGQVLEDLVGDDGDPRLASPDAIVDVARPLSSPIHALFPWNDRDAAEAQRRAVARKLIGQLEIVRVRVLHGRAESARAFYSVKSPDGYRGYAPRSRILSERDLMLQVIGAAKTELENYLGKFERFLAFGRIVPRLRKTIGDMAAEIQRLSDEATAPPRRGGRPRGSGRGASAPPPV
jgi:hypothetical protein